MVKWLVITLLAIVVFITLLLGLGYLLKEHEVATTQLKQQLDQERAQQKLREKRKRAKFIPAIESSLHKIAPNVAVKTSNSAKQKILIENLTCASTKQCVLVDIEFADLTCTFAINTIGASLLVKTGDDVSSVGKCPSYSESSELSCQLNICTYQ